MAGFVIEMTLGDEVFQLAHITAQEMAKVKKWTLFKNRSEWFDAIGEEDPAALIAAYCLVKQRRGEEVRFTHADFDLDELDARFVDDDGRQVEPLVEKNDDGSLKTDKDGRPIQVLKDGRAVWVYSDTREEVPPTPEVAASPATTPDTWPTPGSSSESDSGIPTTSAS